MGLANSATSVLRIAQEGRLLRLTINRAAKRNALNLELCAALYDAIESADPATLGCILVDAEGPSFCAGMDLAESTEVDPDLLGQAHERLFSLHRRARVPIVMFVQGHALAGGTGLAAQAHILLAADDAQFGLTEIRIGMWPLLVYRSIEAAIGARQTLEWSLTGRTVSAGEAREIGLVHHITSHQEAADLAKEISERSGEAVRIGMEYYRLSRELSFEAAGGKAAELRGILLRSPDYFAAIARFRLPR